MTRHSPNSEAGLPLAALAVFSPICLLVLLRRLVVNSALESLERRVGEIERSNLFEKKAIATLAARHPVPAEYEKE